LRWKPGAAVEVGAGVAVQVREVPVVAAEELMLKLLYPLLPAKATM
jgi:hypothetical protein